MNTIEKIKEIINKYECKVRLHWKDDLEIKVSDWDDYFIFPTDDYLELPSIGPVRIADSKILEINPVTIKKIGRRVPPKTIDYTSDVIDVLIAYKMNFCYSDSFIKIEINSSSGQLSDES